MPRAIYGQPADPARHPRATCRLPPTIRWHFRGPSADAPRAICGHPARHPSSPRTLSACHRTPSANHLPTSAGHLPAPRATRRHHQSPRAIRQHLARAAKMSNRLQIRKIMHPQKCLPRIVNCPLQTKPVFYFLFTSKTPRTHRIRVKSSLLRLGCFCLALPFTHLGKDIT